MTRDVDQRHGGVVRRWPGSPSPRLRAVEPLPPLALDCVSKVYRNPMTLRPHAAVRGVSLSLERGEIFGLLGPNGAGKTTTIRMILGLARPTAGRILVEGRDPQDRRARRRLGYLPENPCFYDHLTASEFLELVADLFELPRNAGRRRAAALLERLGLAPHVSKPLRRYSKGMTQRLGLAQALLNEPALLVLDEPMSGLDPIGRAEVKQILREERERGTTILMSSHVLAETETICDRIGILSEGQLLDVGPLAQLLSSGVREWEITLEGLTERTARDVAGDGCRVEAVGARWIARVEDSGALQRALRRAAEAGAIVHAVEPRRRTLEEHFVQVLGRAGGEDR